MRDLIVWPTESYILPHINVVIWLCNKECPKPVFLNIFSMEEPPKNFSYPEEPLPMKTFTGQKKLIAGSAIQLLLNY
jgi:hypothetical protein